MKTAFAIERHQTMLMLLKVGQITMWKLHVIHGMVIWNKPVSIHMFDHLNKKEHFLPGLWYRLLPNHRGSPSVDIAHSFFQREETCSRGPPEHEWLTWLLEQEKWLQRLASSIHVKLTWDPLENLIWNRISSSFRAQRLASYSRA